MIVALTPDLMDRSKVSAAATALGETVQFVGQADRLASRVAAQETDLVVVDLSRPSVLDALRETVAVVTEGGGEPPRIVGFASHVERDLLAEAEAAGCRPALPRSQFFARLSVVLAGEPPA